MINHRKHMYHTPQLPVTGLYLMMHVNQEDLL
jgi:hypothetical protein